MAGPWQSAVTKQPFDDQDAFPEAWTPPPELIGGRPRDVHLSRTGVFTALFAGAICLAAGTAAIDIHLADVRLEANTRTLHERGHEADARVTRLSTVGRGRTTWVAYAFEIDGERFEAETRAPKQVWEGLFVGNTLPVRYLAADPSSNHPRDWDEVPAGLAPVLVLGAALLLVAVYITRLLLRDRHLLADGIPCVGVIYQCRRVRGGWFARYRFRSASGTVRSGGSNLAHHVDVGAVVCVLVDHEHPNRNAPFPLIYFRLAEPGAERSP